MNLYYHHIRVFLGLITTQINQLDYSANVTFSSFVVSFLEEEGETESVLFFLTCLSNMSISQPKIS